jgi:hypothetical protein
MGTAPVLAMAGSSSTRTDDNLYGRAMSLRPLSHGGSGNTSPLSDGSSGSGGSEYSSGAALPALRLPNNFGARAPSAAAGTPRGNFGVCGGFGSSFDGGGSGNYGGDPSGGGYLAPFPALQQQQQPAATASSQQQQQPPLQPLLPHCPVGLKHPESWFAGARAARAKVNAKKASGAAATGSSSSNIGASSSNASSNNSSNTSSSSSSNSSNNSSSSKRAPARAKGLQQPELPPLCSEALRADGMPKFKRRPIGVTGHRCVACVCSVSGKNKNKPTPTYGFKNKRNRL